MPETNAARAAEIVERIDADWTWDGRAFRHRISEAKQDVADAITAALDEAEAEKKRLSSALIALQSNRDAIETALRQMLTAAHERIRSLEGQGRRLLSYVEQLELLTYEPAEASEHAEVVAFRALLTPSPAAQPEGER